MPELNKATIGKEYPKVEVEIKQHETIYYALATNDPNPHYLDGTRPGGVIAPPMYAVHFGGAAVAHVFFDREVGEGFMALLVHGEQEIEWFKAARPGMKTATRAKLLSIEDKGSGELISAQVESVDAGSGEKLCRQVYKFFVRGYGKLEKGKKTAEPDEDMSRPAFTAKEKVMIGQTYAYAEPSGDHNPIHVNDEIAKKVGLGGIILQGLCTMAFCHKAVIQNACGGDPLKLKKFSVRFVKPVRPGDELTITGYHLGAGLIGFEAKNQAGDAVIKKGRAELGQVPA